MKILWRDDTDHNTEYVTLHEALSEIEAMETRMKRAEKTLKAIEDTALEIIPGYGKTGLSDFTTPVSVMYRLRDEVNVLRDKVRKAAELMDSQLADDLDMATVQQFLIDEHARMMWSLKDLPRCGTGSLTNRHKVRGAIDFGVTLSNWISRKQIELSQQNAAVMPRPTTPNTTDQ
jgi:hypothetical protein